jgi:hypothetical protein
MKYIPTTCPECGHESMATVNGKTTHACDKCKWPVDIYEDGRTVRSMYHYVSGPVEYTGNFFSSPRVARP